MENDRQKLLIITICCNIAGIIIVVLGFAIPHIYEYSCGRFDIFCIGGGIWTTIFWIVMGFALIGVGILMTLMLWAS